MQLPLAQLLLALPALGAAIAVPAPVNATDIEEASSLQNRQFAGPPCHINTMFRDLWVEYGKSRWRTTFSASGIDPATFCKYWKMGSNIQCGWDSQVDGGWWRVDCSLDRGPLGDALYWKMLGESRENWRQAYGCTTG